MIDDKRIAEILTRLDEIPAGPWEIRVSQGWWISCEGTEEAVVDMVGWESDPWTAPVTEFIVAARQDIPDLVEEVRHLRDNLGIVSSSALAEGWEQLVAENKRLRAQIELARKALATADITERKGSDHG